MVQRSRNPEGTVELTTQPSARAPAEPAETHQICVAGHELTIFTEALPLVESMVADILAAQHRVWLECYIFVNDRAGEAIAGAIAERARAGLDVRVLYDAVGSQTTPASFFAAMQQAGVQVHAYHTLLDALRHPSFLQRLNRRDHRKLLVVDDRAAYFGGMNIVDNSAARTAEQIRDLPRSAGWRDVHVRLSGPQQADVAESFERSWRRAHGLRVRRRPRAYRRARLAASDESIRFFDSGPGLKHSRAARVFLSLIRRARSSIVLSMAYFLPTGRVLRAMLRARRRGVEVTAVIPGQSDVKLVRYATRHLYAGLLRHGLVIDERQDRMLHSKVMVVDGEWTLVGSCNLDPRSLWTNLEFLAVIRSRALAQTMLDICAHEIANSRRVTLADVRRRRWWQRLADRAAWSLRWWL